MLNKIHEELLMKHLKVPQIRLKKKKEKELKHIKVKRKKEKKKGKIFKLKLELIGIYISKTKQSPTTAPKT